MAEFIVNCNLCLLRYSPNVSFYVTTCGHMKCEPCTAKSDDKTKCAVCKSPAQLIPINNNLNPEMLPFFRPLSYSVDQAKQISKFQDQNKTIIIKNLKNKCKFVKGEMVKCYGALHDLKRENASLHLQLQNMLKAASGNKSVPNRPPIFPTSDCSASSSIFSIQPNALGSNPTLFPQSTTPWTNSSRIGTRMNAHRPFNSRQTFMTPSASSVADDSSESCFDRRPSRGRIHPVMMPFRNLKK
ncbi:hypothetical protein PPYR_07816 [Photinus pyralis]|uniref:RING-type domain-containing protein n=1 Tax=Photinus pyralis TaxID=7054 RepID=A0A1Y1MW95_PHOPY|nr:RING finger protein 212B-like [Photinus pyralis]KAB0799936.1 hypothetical protein PPYR_07816 [Photinus pyralis]